MLWRVGRRVSGHHGRLKAGRTEFQLCFLSSVSPIVSVDGIRDRWKHGLTSFMSPFSVAPN
jgi:hypothetical protein